MHQHASFGRLGGINESDGSVEVLRMIDMIGVAENPSVGRMLSSKHGE